MKNILSLTKISLLSFTRFYFLGLKNTKKKKKTQLIPTIILYILSFAYLTFLALKITSSIASPLIAVHQGSLFVGYVLLINIFMCFLQALMSCPGIMYFTKDNNTLLPLPLKAHELLISKYLTILVFEYLTILFFGIIPLFRYGLLAGSGLGFYLMSILVLIVLPIFPLMLAVCIVVVSLSFMKLTRHKGAFQVLGTLIVIAISIAINFVIQSQMQKNAAVAIANGGLVNLLRSYFPTFSFALDSLVGPNILTILTSFTLLVASSLVIIYIGILIGNKFYFKGLVGALFGTSLVVGGKVKTKAYATKGLLFSFVKKEIFMLIRTPIYVSQILLPIIFMPVFYIGIGIYGFLNSGAKITEFQGILAGVADSEVLRYLFLFSLAVVVFGSFYAYGSITAFSREGEGAIFLKQLPLTLWQIVKYKSIVNSFIILCIILPILFIAAIYTGFSLPLTFLALFLMLVYAFGNSVNLAIFDALKPRLHWSSEMELLKGNFRIFFSVVYAAIHLGFLALLAFVIKNLYLDLILITLFELAFLFMGYYFSTHYEKRIVKHII